MRFAQGQIDNVMQHLHGLAVGLPLRRAPGHQGEPNPKPAPTRAESIPPAASAGNRPAPGPRGDQARDCGETLSQIALWTAGSLDYGSGGREKVSSSGLTLGVDAELGARLVVGAAFGRGFGDSRVGARGSRIDSASANVMAYVSHRVARAVAVEAMGGRGGLHTDNQRFVTLDGRLLGSRRAGHMTYASLSVGGQANAGRLSISPY